MATVEERRRTVEQVLDEELGKGEAHCFILRALHVGCAAYALGVEGPIEPRRREPAPEP